MKLQIKDLIIDKYYYCLNINLADNSYYIKYKGYENDHILCDNWYLAKYKEDYNYKNTGNEFATTIFYDNCSIFKEVDFCLIIDYLPNTNIDKITYLRKVKIESLLKKI